MGTHSSLLTQTGKGQSALEKQKPEVAGEQYLHTPLATFAHKLSPFSSCSHKIILCNTKTMTGLKLKKLYGFNYVLYMHISSPFLLDSGSSFQCKQPLFRSQCLWLLLQSNPAKPLLQQSKFFFISVIPTTPKLNLIRQ